VEQLKLIILCNRPLHLAVLQGFIEVVFSLVRIFPDPWFLEVPNKRMQVISSALEKCIFL
jgi:hypothetical protein